MKEEGRLLASSHTSGDRAHTGLTPVRFSLSPPSVARRKSTLHFQVLRAAIRLWSRFSDRQWLCCSLFAPIARSSRFLPSQLVTSDEMKNTLHKGLPDDRAVVSVAMALNPTMITWEEHRRKIAEIEAHLNLEFGVVWWERW